MPLLHSGESRDLRALKMADSCQNPSIQVRLSLIFPLILTRLAWGLKQIPLIHGRNMCIFSDFQTKIWLNSLRVLMGGGGLVFTIH